MPSPIATGKLQVGRHRVRRAEGVRRCEEPSTVERSNGGRSSARQVLGQDPSQPGRKRDPLRLGALRPETPIRPAASADVTSLSRPSMSFMALPRFV